MLPIVAWLAVYTLAFYSLGLVIEPWRKTSWFKALLFPGTLLAVGVQKLASLLCLGRDCKVSLLKDGEPPFAVPRSQVPFFAWALFIFLSHLFLYTVFIVAVTSLERAGWVDVHLVSLPTLHAYDMMEGYVKVDARGYISDLSDLRRFARENNLVSVCVLYVIAGSYSALTLSRKQCRWSLMFLLLIGLVSFAADWLGTGFPFLTRGWWAGFSLFPRCWALFSLYVTLLLVVSTLFGFCRFIPYAVDKIRNRGDDDEESR